MMSLSENNSKFHCNNMALQSNLNPNAKEFVPSTMKWTSKECNLAKDITTPMETGELPDSKLSATSEVTGDCMLDSMCKQKFKKTAAGEGHSAEIWKDLLDEFNGKGRQLYMINVLVGYQSKNVIVKLISKNKKQLPERQKAIDETIQIDLSASSTLELKTENLLAAKLLHGVSILINEKIVEAEYSGGSEYSEDEIAHQIEHIKMLETVFSHGRETSTDESIVQCALGELCKELGIPEKEIDETTDESIGNLSNDDNNLACYYDNELHTSDNSFKSSEENNGSKLFKYQSSDGCELHVNQMSDCEDKMECFEKYVLEAPPTTPALSRTDVSIRAINDAMNMKPKVSKGSTLNGAIRKTCQAVLGSKFKSNFSTEPVSGCRCTAGANRLYGGGGDIIHVHSKLPEPHKITETKKCGSGRQAKHMPNRTFNYKAPLKAESNLKKVTNRSGTCSGIVKNLNDKNTHNMSSKIIKTKRASQKNSVRGTATSSGCRQNETRKAQAIWKL